MEVVDEGDGLECGGTTPLWMARNARAGSADVNARSAGNQSADMSAHSKPGAPALPIVRHGIAFDSHGFFAPNSPATLRLPAGGEDIRLV